MIRQSSSDQWPNHARDTEHGSHDASECGSCRGRDCESDNSVAARYDTGVSKTGDRTTDYQSRATLCNPWSNLSEYGASKLSTMGPTRDQVPELEYPDSGDKDGLEVEILVQLSPHVLRCSHG